MQPTEFTKMKSKLESAAHAMLDLTHFSTHMVVRALRAAVEDPWFSCPEVLPEVPPGLSSVEVLGVVVCDDPDYVTESDATHVVAFWKERGGVPNVWTVSVAGGGTREPYDAPVSVSSWHPIPARSSKGG